MQKFSGIIPGSYNMKIEFKSIKPKLTILLILIAVIPLIILSLVAYNQLSGAIQERELNKLKAIRDLKVQQIEKWLDERSGDIRIISGKKEIRNLEAINNQQNESGYNYKIVRSVRERLENYKENYTYYEEISILNNSTGEVIVSTDKSLEGQEHYNNIHFTEPVNSDLYVSDIYYSKKYNNPSMVITCPVYSITHTGKHIIGIILGRINIELIQKELFLDRTGLGMTGETFIINRDSIVLSDLRWHSNAQLKLKLNSEPALNAASGHSGAGESIDYRGVNVLTAYTYIPGTRWGLIVKQDLDEVYEPVYLMLRDFSVFLVIAIIIVYSVASLLAKSLSSPIIEITNTSMKIQNGDLSARNTVSGSDEVGYLAKSVNNMADFMVSQIEIQHGSAEIIETIATADELTDFRKKLLIKLMDISESSFGAYYRLNREDNKFYPFTSVGLNADALTPFDSSIMEGIFGNALVNKKIDYITNIPEDIKFEYKTFAGSVNPKEIIIIPLIIETEVRGIVCLGKIEKYSDKILKILNHTWKSINTALSNLLAHIEAKRLAGELNQKNAELMFKSEEMSSQAKLLEEQSRELQAQNLVLEEQRNQVEQANRLKSEFLSNMSHELRTPLNSILSLTRVLIMQAKEKLSAEEMNFLNVIDRNGKSLLNLINDILDLSKIEAGRVDVRLNRFSVASLIDLIIESLEHLAREKGIKLIQIIPEPLPDIETDEDMMRHVLQNIVGNAIKFTQEGSVTVSAYNDDNNILIEVADTGIGISTKDLPHIFDEFWQADGSHSRKYEGTGLGLSISYKILANLKGRIEVESEIGKGSTFRIILPVKWDINI